MRLSKEEVNIMFSRAHMILDAFDRQVAKDDNEIPQEVEEQESVVFHTFGDLDKYQGAILVDVEEDESIIVATKL